MAVVQTLIGNIKGPQGEQGEQGEQGAQGNAATISVGSVTTVPYGTNASVVNSGTEEEAVLDFRIPQGRPGEQVTQLDNLVLNSITEPSAQFPIPAIGDIGSVLFGKVSKWFGDMSALVATKLNAANVVNNLITTASGYALDARQGKALNDKLKELTTNESSGSGTINTQYATETSQQWYKKGQFVCVNISIHLKNISSFTQVTLGTGFPPSNGMAYCVNSLTQNDAPAYGFLTVDTSGKLMLNNRGNVYGTNAITVIGQLLYIAK